MNYVEALEFLQNSGKLGINLGLERITKLLGALNNPHEKIRTIHVAGTNGKGSTIAMLESILSEAGLKVGVYTSPHLHSYRERFKINSKLISEKEFGKEILEIKEALSLAGKLDQSSPTEFEILTAVALNYFYKESVDIAIIEVGMGGRLDSTNVLHPLFSIITPIAKDHEGFLGNTHKEIALEKAGILKENTPVVLAKQRQECENIVIKEAQKKNCKIYFSREIKTQEVSFNDLGQSIEIKSKAITGEVFLSLLGEHQRDNMKTVLKSIELLVEQGFLISKLDIEKGLRKVKWAGRIELIKKERSFLLDGAHNPQGAQALKLTIRKHLNYNKLIIILGILEDKDQEKIIQHLLNLTQTFIITKPDNVRAQNWENPGKIIQESSGAQVIFEEDVEEAIKIGVRMSGKEDLICITGSLYLIGQASSIIQKEYALV